MYALLRPLLFAMDAERAHHRTLQFMEAGYRAGLSRLMVPRAPDLPTTLAGLPLRHPVGLAAGLDKNGEYIDALFALDFSFVEVGTVTPRPQAGNPKPRLFRLKDEMAVINRFGFNNDGVDALVRNVERARNRTGQLGINIGKNKDTDNERAADDYLHCLERVHAHADYVTVNISSPNTVGLRALQEQDALKELLSRLRDMQLRLNTSRRVPMFVKIAPDLNDSDLDSIAQVLAADVVDGVIATNTTIDRPLPDSEPLRNEAGGLSGAPLLPKANATLQALLSRIGNQLPVIGVGGITQGEHAAQKMQMGAQAVQLYSGLVYRGPELIAESVHAIAGARTA